MKNSSAGLGTYRTLKTDAEVDAERVADLEAMNARENTTCDVHRERNARYQRVLWTVVALVLLGIAAGVLTCSFRAT